MIRCLFVLLAFTAAAAEPCFQRISAQAAAQNRSSAAQEVIASSSPSVVWHRIALEQQGPREKSTQYAETAGRAARHNFW